MFSMQLSQIPQIPKICVFSEICVPKHHIFLPLYI